jgi:thiol-disulfide isomerase/thioredoxin
MVPMRICTGTQPRSVNPIFALLAVVAFGLALAAHGRAQNPPSKSASTPASHSSPAAEMRLIDLEGYRKLVADHHGKPLLITFWATWCEPCRDEYPLVNQLAKEYAAKGLTVVGVDMDDDAEITLVHHFLDRNQPIFPNVHKKMGHADEFWDGVDPRWKGTMPANFFYAADGQLVGFMTGGRPRPDFEKMIQATLAASPHAPTHP